MRLRFFQPREASPSCHPEGALATDGSHREKAFLEGKFPRARPTLDEILRCAQDDRQRYSDRQRKTSDEEHLDCFLSLPSLSAAESRSRISRKFNLGALQPFFFVRIL
jgi:hypothetical protein